MQSYSQFGQDTYCFNHFFKGYSGGTFLEIGADDGIDKSNTLFFENIGWNGLCIEPSPLRFRQLRENRRCGCENLAISDREKTEKFMDIAGYGKGLSGIVAKYDPRHLKRIQKELEHPQNNGYRIIDVECMSINALLEKHRMLSIDFCSIDTEGGELEILRSIDSKRYRFDVICVENNYESTGIRDFMASVGFDRVARLNIDEVYKRIPHR
jgi:FkbM family methyltransferase